MVKFLIHRPIAVSMTFLAILILGIVASVWLPVSLMPDIDIPRITVHISSPNTSARELENSTVGIFRRQLMQVEHLSDITSESRDGNAVITLEFDYGSSIDFAFIEVNEKIDRAMGSLPNDMERPRVIKASATDIPVFYLNLTLRSNEDHSGPAGPVIIQTGPSGPSGAALSELFPVSQQFTDLSSFAGQVISKRIEQLPEVAIADISGQVFPELLILPDLEKLSSLGMTTSDLENEIRQNNVSLGNLIIRDGQYQYNVRFENTLLNKQDIEQIYIKQNSRLLQLKDIATVLEHPRKIKGRVTSDGKDAITMAIIKQSDARMEDLKDNLYNLVSHFRTDYPDVDFTVTRDQTRLLTYSINNLKQSLLIGGLLAFLVMFLFLKDVRSPLLIGVTIPTALVISLLFFYITRLSINIVSLSGLILGIGMMIDNSIIVIDNITQFRERGYSLDESCVLGTNEVFRPMLSSVLTTCAVFIPLIFIGGISGALFYDQAIAITIGLLVSLVVSVTLLPVYYRIAYIRGRSARQVKWLERINRLDYARLYEKGFRFTMRNQPWIWMMIIVMLAGCVWLYSGLKKEKMPQLTRDDIYLSIDWNERINLDENFARVRESMRFVDSLVTQHTSLIGEQQFLMDHHSSLTAAQAGICLQASDERQLNQVMEQLTGYFHRKYPQAIFRFEDSGNIIELIFAEKQAPLIARLRATRDFGPMYNTRLQETINGLTGSLQGYSIPPVAWEEQIVLKADPAMLVLYDMDQGMVLQALRNAFSENQIMLITGSQQFIPVIVGEEPKTLEEIIQNTTVRNRQRQDIRLASLFSMERDIDLKSIVAGKEGEYYPVPVQLNDQDVVPVSRKINRILAGSGFFEAGFSGSYYTNREMVRDLLLILSISLLLLYFILAAQFESLVLPGIVLLEVPIDIFGAFLFLRLFGGSINLMSLIGIVVMSGVIINDSILKVDTINRMFMSGAPILKSLIIGGQRRLKPIIMTSLTTILALLPFFFMKGFGSDLQKPLALTFIGGMIVGTMVSLFFIPLLYYYLMRNKKQKKKPLTISSVSSG